MAYSLSILLDRRFVVVVLAALMPIAVSEAHPRPPGDAAAGAYASEVPNEALVDDRGEPPVAVGDEGSIPVAEEIDFIVGNKLAAGPVRHRSMRSV